MMILNTKKGKMKNGWAVCRKRQVKPGMTWLNGLNRLVNHLFKIKKKGLTAPSFLCETKTNLKQNEIICQGANLLIPVRGFRTAEAKSIRVSGCPHFYLHHQHISILAH